ncbi:6-carboxytetrahydropterin synthase [Methanospirillum stamsii]
MQYNSCIHVQPDHMQIRLYKEVSFDASHRLLHYQGKCHNLHGHRWRVEVWLSGCTDKETNILVDYNEIREVVDYYDHEIILNESDPMVPRIQEFHDVITTPGDPTSELLALLIRDEIERRYQNCGRNIIVDTIRVWESPTGCAELRHEDS